MFVRPWARWMLAGHLLCGLLYTDHLCAQPAQAEPPSASAVSDKVRELYNAGLAAYQRKDMATAHKHFSAAWALEKKARIAGNLGRVELALGKFRDAAEHLSFFLREEPSLAPEARANLEKSLADAKAKVLTLRVELAAEGAELWLDGVSLGQAPFPAEIYLEPGKHTVRAAWNTNSDTREVEGAEGTATTVKLAPPKPPPVRFVAAPPAPEAPRAPAPKPFATPLVVGIAGGVLMLAGVGVGIGAGVASQAKEAERQECIRPSRVEQQACWESHERSRRDLAVGSAAGMIAGGAALLAAGGYLVYTLAPLRKTSFLRITPVAGGLVLSGAW